jgi:hypothetical protein
MKPKVKVWCAKFFSNEMFPNYLDDSMSRSTTVDFLAHKNIKPPRGSCDSLVNKPRRPHPQLIRWTPAMIESAKNAGAPRHI